MSSRSHGDLSSEENGDLSSEETWLLAIGRGLRTEFDVLEHPIPEPLAELLKQLQDCEAKVESPAPAHRGGDEPGVVGRRPWPAR